MSIIQSRELETRYRHILPLIASSVLPISRFTVFQERKIPRREIFVALHSFGASLLTTALNPIDSIFKGFCFRSTRQLLKSRGAIESDNYLSAVESFEVTRKSNKIIHCAANCALRNRRLIIVAGKLFRSEYRKLIVACASPRAESKFSRKIALPGKRRRKIIVIIGLLNHQSP